VLIHGLAQGTGKTLIGYTLGRIHGKNFTEIDQGSLHGDFNEWAEGKTLVLGDEITGSDRRADADVLKRLITQQRVRVNKKFVPTYEVPDCCNFLFTSNHPDAFFLEDDDRRHFIHEVTAGPLPDVFYAEYGIWLDSGGSSYLFDWLLSRDISEFNPAARAPRTQARDRMTLDTKSDLGAWIEHLKRDPDDLLMLGEQRLPGDLFTSRQLHALYDPTGRTQVSINGIGRELRRAGFSQVAGGRPVEGHDGRRERYYAIRNADRWTTRDHIDAARHLKELYAANAAKKGAKF
jgi:hypothetical protein